MKRLFIIIGSVLIVLLLVGGAYMAVQLSAEPQTEAGFQRRRRAGDAVRSGRQ